jgi:protein phosphatase
MSPEEISLESHGVTDRGQLREHNEDSFVVEEGAGLFVVCDGMGGHAGGEVASKIATETIAEFIGKHRDDDWPYGREAGAPEAADLLRNAALLANQRITERIESEPWLARMGTTMVSALVESDGRCHLANVGDSRGYLWRQGALRQLTSDHSWVNEQVLRGLLSRTEAETHPLKNVITRALGAKDTLPVDLLEDRLEAGDRLLLCSDGLTGMLSDEEISVVLAQTGATSEEICRQLVEEANLAGGEDNITVVLVTAK